MSGTSIFDTIGSWLNSAFHTVINAGTKFIGSLPLPGIGTPSTGGSGTGGTGGSGTGGSGTGGSGTGGTGTGSSGSGSTLGNLFGAPIEFFQHLIDPNTWFRVGLVLLGIALVVIAVKMFMRAAENVNRVDGLLNRVGA